MITLTPTKTPLQGSIDAPGDKSISHRAIILGSLAKGNTRISNFLPSEDCLYTIKVCQQLGVKINYNQTEVEITGQNLKLKEPSVPLYFGNSGTTARLMLGVLAGQDFFSSVYGDKYLSERPMKRVVTPLKKMGAIFDGRENSSLLPLSIRGSQLHSIRYRIPVKSAQVKSAILLAGLFAKGETTVIEKGKTRDHTEKMLASFQAQIQIHENEITLIDNQLQGTDILIPGDISSSAYFLVAALLVPNSHITIRNVSLNETRTGILTVLKEMGATFTITNEKMVNHEPVGDISISHQQISGTVIEGDIIPKLIDEIPIIALLATQAEGKTVIRHAEELRVKETDRIHATVQTLKSLGAHITETKDGMIIKGGTSLKGGKVSSYFDHRMAMMAAIASLICQEKVFIDELDSINISYPNFFEHLKQLKNVST